MSSKASLFIACSNSHQWALYDSFKTSLDKAGCKKLIIDQSMLADLSPSKRGLSNEVEALQRGIASEIAGERDVLVLAHRWAAIPLTEALAGVQCTADDMQTSFDVLGLLFPAAPVPEGDENLASVMMTSEAGWVKIDGDSAYAPSSAQNLYHSPTPQALVSEIAAQVVPHYKPRYLRRIGETSWKYDAYMYVKLMKEETTGLEHQDRLVETLRNAVPDNAGENTVVELESDRCREICIPGRKVEEVMSILDALGLSGLTRP